MIFDLLTIRLGSRQNIFVYYQRENGVDTLDLELMPLKNETSSLYIIALYL